MKGVLQVEFYRSPVATVLVLTNFL